MAWLATKNLSGIHQQTLEVPTRAFTFAATGRGVCGDCERTNATSGHAGNDLAEFWGQG